MGFDTQLVHALDHTADVMAEHLAQQFVGLRDARLAANACGELRLHHREHRLNY